MRVLLVFGLLGWSGLACRAGTNPSATDIRAMLVAAGQAHKVPPQILFAMAFTESGWQQFNIDGSTHLNKNDGGIGIMQITGATAGPFDHNRLMTDIAYNIDAGAQVLAGLGKELPKGKWDATPVIGDGNGMVGREKLENWYYAIWAYNSWGYKNNPNNKNTPPPYTAKAVVYQDTVYGYLRQPPAALAALWQPVNITAPSLADIGSITTGGIVGCGQPIANTPAPYHSDANFDGVIDGTTGGGSDTEIYVDINGSSSGDGSSGNPFNTIAQAITKANATASVVVYVKAGWYKEKIGTSKHIHFVPNGSGTVRVGG